MTGRRAAGSGETDPAKEEKDRETEADVPRTEGSGRIPAIAVETEKIAGDHVIGARKKRTAKALENAARTGKTERARVSVAETEKIAGARVSAVKTKRIGETLMIGARTKPVGVHVH